MKTSSAFGGYGRALLLVVLVPLLWSFPTGLMLGELASAIPAEGGFYAWVCRALGPFWGFQEAWLSLAASVFDMAIYPTTFVLYLERLAPAMTQGHRALLLKRDACSRSWLSARPATSSRTARPAPAARRGPMPRASAPSPGLATASTCAWASRSRSSPQLARRQPQVMPPVVRLPHDGLSAPLRSPRLCGPIRSSTNPSVAHASPYRMSRRQAFRAHDCARPRERRRVRRRVAVRVISNCRRARIGETDVRAGLARRARHHGFEHE